MVALDLHLDSGYLVIALSVAFFAVASYAILFSAFLPLTGNAVRGMTDINGKHPITFSVDPGYPRKRYSLQILRGPHCTHHRIFRHRQLGGMAVLP